MLGTLLIVLGALLIVGSIVAGYYVAFIACTTAIASGCQDNAIDSIAQLMISNQGMLYWLAWVVGIYLIWGGVRLQSRK